ncbi:MAG: DUF3300 domain-containing protein [Deltaproteobacteria bacterium]|nr:DUF3300 domain-containing protein [Deltaproteobacteria bacterium]
MNRIGIKGFLLIFVVCLSALLSIQAGESNASPAYLDTDQELDNFLAPIALYPDPLLAQILPASTYPAEIAAAEAWLNSGGTLSSIDGQTWDESVKAIAHYPGILKMMAGNMDWTADLGDTFLNQPEEVTRSIQRLRWQAREAGNLESTSQQTIVIVGDYIEIVPAQPQYIYVPRYDPSVIYIQRWAPGRLPFITFGLGLAIGGWLTMDFDWGHHNVIYHGWNRPGWVNHARPHVRIKNVYVNRSRPYISQKWKHNASHGDPERYRASRPGGGTSVGRNTRIPEIRGSTTTPPKPQLRVFGPRGDTHSFSNRGKESRGVVSTPSTKPPQNLGKRPTMPVPSVSKQPLPPAPGIGKDSSQPRPARERLQPARTPSVTFGGYRGDKEARSQSLRGKDSRQSSEGIRPSAPVSKGRDPAGKGDVRGRTPAGKDDIRGKQRQ